MTCFANLVSTISNNRRRQRHVIFYPFTLKVLNVLGILRLDGYILSFRFCFINGKSFFEILLKNVDNVKLQNSFKLISCSRRLKYFSKKDLKKTSNKIGLVILSTPLGIFSDRKAVLLNVGGKALFYVC
jgi:ribosomal protein S8